jgi:ribosomal protein S18 acetylase RimI-like enzyme
MNRRTNIQILPGREEYREFSFLVKKLAYGAAIAAVWGWNETREQRSHATDWEENPPRIIRVGDEPVGTVRLRFDKGYFSLSQFCVLPTWQRRGIGSCVLDMVLAEADEAGLAVRLACLPDNPARRLYERYGFRQVSADDTFIYLERNPVPHSGRDEDE